MKRLFLFLAAASGAFSQTSHWYERLTGPYAPKPVPAVSFENSTRIHDLLRAGSLYLSLSDAIALAIENNLDVEYERWEPKIAATDTKRAKGGGTLRGISLDYEELPPGVGGPATPLLNTPAGSSLPGSTVPTGIDELVAIQPPPPSGIAITGAAPLSTGPPIPAFDPALTANLQYQHQNTPEPNTFLNGTPSLVGYSLGGSAGLQKGFSTGTLLGLSFDSTQQSTNSTRNTINPYTTSNLGLSLTQPLLRGFGVNMNRRFIRIAQNNERTSNLVFREQAIATVAGIIRLYEDLVSYTEDVKVKQETLALAERLYEDNRQQVTQGTLAPIELTRAEAEVAAARQDLSNSQGFEEQQELLLKTLLTRRGTADPAIRNARVVATTPIHLPANEPATPLEQMVASAFGNRPELAEARLQLENSHISLEGSRNELLPELNLVANAQNTGLAGTPNGSAQTSGNGGAATPTSGGETYNGGFGTGLSQIFTGRYPTYSAGIQLVLPLRNRVAQADYAHDEMQVRQWQIRYQQLENQVRLEVEGAWIAVNRSRAALEAATQARELQEKSLQIEMEKFATGLSTTYLVMQYQGMVAQARSTEVAARGVYAKAQTSLERALGETLQNHNITFEEAYRGKLRQ